MNRLIERRFLLPSLLVAVAAVWVLAQPGMAMARDKGDKGKKATEIEGTLVAVNVEASTITIQTRSGAKRDVAVTDATKIERNEVKALLKDLKIGDRVEAKINAAGATTKVEATGP